MKDEIDHGTEAGDSLVDPEPVSIAIGILGAIASIGAVFFQKAIDDYRDESERRVAVRNSIYSAYRSLTVLEGTLKVLVSYVNQYNFWNASFRLGQVHFLVDQNDLLQIQKMHSDIFTAGLALSESTMILAGHLDNEDFAFTARYAQEVNDLIFGAMTSQNYKSFIVRSTRLIDTLENMVNKIGIKYGFEPPERLMSGAYG